jgi:hypothetical protein
MLLQEPTRVQRGGSDSAADPTAGPRMAPYQSRSVNTKVNARATLTIKLTTIR